jgi:transposase
MGEDWTLIGYDRSEQLAVIPRQVYVIVSLRAKYVPRHEEVPGAEVGVKIAPRAAQIIPKSIAHHSLLAAIITGKFVDGLPLTPKNRSSPARGSHSAARPWPGCSPNCTPHSPRSRRPCRAR